MAYNNTIILTGNTGDEVRINRTNDNKSFASLHIATTDSYKDNDGNWQNNQTIWHNVVAFNPNLIEALKSYKKGTRLQITGAISYRPFEVRLEDGTVITKKEASIIAKKVEQAPLAKKQSV